MLRKKLTSRSAFNIENIQRIARKTGFIVRSSKKFTAEGFLFSLLKAVSSGQASFNQIAMAMAGQTVQTISRQALWKRIDRKAVSFLISVIEDLINDHSLKAIEGLKSAQFARVLVEDSTTHRMPKSNAENFRAHGNASGSTAGVKCDLCYDLLSQDVISFGLYGATEQDRVIGKEVLTLAKKGDLIVRDMGYFDLSEFSYLESIGADWFSRLPQGVQLVDERGIELEDILNESSQDKIDLSVFVGEVRHGCRLVAVRADNATREKRRRERNAAARKQGKTPSKKALIRDGWHLMLTSVSKEQVSAGVLSDLYRSRWAIEIQFRAWKQSSHLATALNRKSNPDHLEALVYSSMIIALLGLRKLRLFASQLSLSEVSPEKICHWLTQRINEAGVLGELFSVPPDSRHIRRDSRKRKLTVIQALTGLS